MVNNSNTQGSQQASAGAQPTPARRWLWLAGGAMAASATAGVIWQVWRMRSPPIGPPDAAAEFWQMRFKQPRGGELAMASLLSKPLVLNFWASWCAPCVREMPELDRFHRNFGERGWQVLGLAIDNEVAVVQFLDRVPVGFTIALAGADGTDLMMRLGNEKGGLPFTVVFDRRGAPVRRHLGATTYAQLEAWATNAS